MWRPLAIAIALLTRVPVPGNAPLEPQAAGRSVLWYPAVGLLIGLVLVSVCWFARSAPAMVGAALTMLAWSGISGGLHLDGLSDSTDALIGSHGDAARALEIMQDPSAGPMGVTAVCLILIAKFAAVTAHISSQFLWPIVAAPVVGRAAVIALLLTTPYVRRPGLGDVLSTHLPRDAATMVLAAALVAAVCAGGVAPVIGAALAFLFLRMLMMRTIGGTTGDTAGALVEVTEAAALVAATL